jgi:methyltransferase (TIGR00027 family)
VKTDSLISHVSDTARWVAVYRAMETERPDALFRDPHARRLAGAKGQAIVDGMKNGKASAWPMIVRTVLLDTLIMQAVRDGYDTVLNLAAGLDVRAYRMTLPAALHWIDVDHPDMVAYKAEGMKGETPACEYESVPLDLADVEARRALFARINARAGKTLVITEGLLIYLTAEQVTSLATDLHGYDTFTRWASDLASAALLKMMGRTWGRTVAAGNAPFQFGPANGPAFFAPMGWKELSFHSQFDEGIRLKRTFPMAKFYRWLGSFSSARKKQEFKYFSGVVLLGRV